MFMMISFRGLLLLLSFLIVFGCYRGHSELSDRRWLVGAHWNSFRVFGLADRDVFISAARWAFHCSHIGLQNQPRRLREVFCFIEFMMMIIWFHWVLLDCW